MRLGRFFTLGELVRTSAGLPNDPSPQELVHLTRLVTAVLDPLREATGYAMRVNSGFRSEAVNEVIGGHPQSSHCEGRAADVRPEDSDREPLHLYAVCSRSRLPYDKLIYEVREHPRGGFSQWIHVQVRRWGADRPPRRKNLMSLRPGSFELFDVDRLRQTIR